MRDRLCAPWLVAIAVTAFSFVPPGAAADRPPLHGGAPPVFTSDMAISVDSEGRPALSVSVTVPYPELQWVRLSGGYGAGVDLMVSLEPEQRGARVFGDAWQRRLAVAAFEQTLPASSALVELRTFRVPAGRYRARISVQDLNAGLGSSVTERIEVPDYSKVSVGLSDLELGTGDSSGRFNPVTTRVFGRDVSGLAARAALFDRRPGGWPRDYEMHYRILDDQGLEIRAGQVAATLRHSAELVLIRPAQSDLFLGSYVFEVSLVEGRSRWRVDRSFEVEESGPPQGKEFTRMLEVLSYIAEPKEMERLRSLKPEGQAVGWEEFWRKRDQAPGTGRNEAMIEFFRRVRYTERHFQGFGPGWRSDMGRIYIKYGPPEQIETRAAEIGTTTLETWTYSRPLRRFIFEDRDGFGRFVLVSPAFE